MDGIITSMDMSLSKLQGVGEGQGSLPCCSPWSHKELDTTEWLNNNNRCPRIPASDELNVLSPRWPVVLSFSFQSPNHHALGKCKPPGGLLEKQHDGQGALALKLVLHVLGSSCDSTWILGRKELNKVCGTCLTVWWLRLCTYNAGVEVGSLVRELRSLMLHGQ